jgi:adenylate kinase family enzyme
MVQRRIHILGASGSGTSTLATALADKLQCKHFDVDQFCWLQTDPPFQTIRPRQERVPLLQEALASSVSWTLSGSLCGWGDSFISQFDLVVFLSMHQNERLARLRAREATRYGAAILPGGVMYKQHQDFMEWAASYEEGGLDTRSRKLHEHWLAALPCPVIRLEGEMPTDAQVSTVLRHFNIS